MIQALIAGETDPANLAALVDRRIKASPQQLREALHGRVTDHHRFLLHLHLQYIDFADTAIQDIDRNVAALTPGWIRRWRPVGSGPAFKA